MLIKLFGPNYLVNETVRYLFHHEIILEHQGNHKLRTSENHIDAFLL